MKTNKFYTKIIFLVIGGFILTFSGVNWYIGIASWIAPIFLLYYTRTTKWSQFIFFFLVLCISGLFSQTAHNFFNIPILNIINGISLGVFTGLYYVIDKILYKKNDKFYYSLVFPAAVVIVEYTLSSMMGTWGIIAHTQYEIKPLLQLSSITGVFGISFLVAWFPSVINWVIEKKEYLPTSYKGILIYGSVLIIVLIYGEFRPKFSSKNSETVKIAAVISEMDIHKVAASETENLEKLAADYTLTIPDHIFSDSTLVNTLINRTKEASENGAKIVVWNEVAVILSQEQKKSLVSKIKLICSKHNNYVLLAFLEEEGNRDKKPFNNTSILISPKGKVLWTYLKSHLHLSAEEPIINRGNAIIPVLETQYGKIGNVICYDFDFPGFIRQAGEKSVEIMLVPSYDWHEITPLHPQMATINAIQFGFSIVRSNGKGLTSFYDNMGNTIASVNTATSNAKILYANVPVKSIMTFYSKFGDWLVILAGTFLLFLLVIRVKKSFKKEIV